MEAAHRQVEIEVGEWRAEVDAGIAPLIRAMWEQGLRTEFSCEGYRAGGSPLTYAYVSMPADDFARFLDLTEHIFEITAGRAFAPVGSRVVVGKLPEGVRWAETRELTACSAERTESGWKLRCSIHFPPELIPAATDAVLAAQEVHA